MQNKELVEELHKPIIRKFKNKKCWSFRGNIWGADLADMQLLSKFNKEIRFLLCVIDVYSEDVWVIPLEDKNSMTVFQKLLDESGRKPDNIWVDNFTIDQWNHR